MKDITRVFNILTSDLLANVTVFQDKGKEEVETKKGGSMVVVISMLSQSKYRWLLEEYECG